MLNFINDLMHKEILRRIFPHRLLIRFICPLCMVVGITRAGMHGQLFNPQTTAKKAT